MGPEELEERIIETSEPVQRLKLAILTFIRATVARSDKIDAAKALELTSKLIDRMLDTDGELTMVDDPLTGDILVIIKVSRVTRWKFRMTRQEFVGPPLPLPVYRMY